MTATIIQVHARKILDSRGNQTVEIDVETELSKGTAAAPSGASRGRWEAEPYPKGGVEAAVKLVREIVSPALRGVDACDQAKVDAKLHEIDGTDRFTTIGGNTAYAISLASAKAAASSKGVQLFQHLQDREAYDIPIPLGNVIGGGMHAQGPRTDIQELLVLPFGCSTLLEAATINAETHREVAKLAGKNGTRIVAKGDEGAWVLDLDTDQSLSLVQEACETVSRNHGVEVRIGIDMASSTLWDEKKTSYIYRRDRKSLQPDEQLEFVLRLIRQYKLVYVEDPFHEEDFESFAQLKAGTSKSMICGDDLVVTNTVRLRKAAEANSINAVIIKPNQVGTITDSEATSRLAKTYGFVLVASHRSGEIPSGDLAHLAVGFQSPVIKCGVVGGERMAKVNELIRIEEQLQGRGKLAKIIC